MKYNLWNSSEPPAVLIQNMHNLHFSNLNTSVRKLSIVTTNTVCTLFFLITVTDLQHCICVYNHKVIIMVCIFAHHLDVKQGNKFYSYLIMNYILKHNFRPNLKGEGKHFLLTSVVQTDLPSAWCINSTAHLLCRQAAYHYT
jgi:hypothetical protein